MYSSWLEWVEQFGVVYGCEIYYNYKKNKFVAIKHLQSNVHLIKDGYLQQGCTGEWFVMTWPDLRQYILQEWEIDLLLKYYRVLFRVEDFYGQAKYLY